MAEYIEREAVLELLRDIDRYGYLDGGDINSIPAADVVAVVRCEDCIHYKPGKHFTDINFCHRIPDCSEKGGLNTADDDFCSYGERRESE